MPSITYFIKELLTEEKYSTEYSSRIEERIQALNAAQLQGMYNHLMTTANKSKTAMWKASNQEIIDRIARTLAQRTKEEQAERKIIDEYKLKQKQKRTVEREAKREKVRVMQMIEEKAHQTAETEIRDLENQREAVEKVEIIKSIYKGEERRNRWFMGLVCLLIVTIVLVAVLEHNFLYIIAIIGGMVLIILALAYRAYLFTEIRPKQVLPSELAERIAARQAALKEEALEQLQEKERHFQEQQKKDRQERRRLRAIRQERQQYEAELLEQQRLDRIRMAREVISRKESAWQQQQQQQQQQSQREISDGSVPLFSASLESHSGDDSNNIEQQTYLKIIRHKDLFHHNNPGEGDDSSVNASFGLGSSQSESDGESRPQSGRIDRSIVPEKEADGREEKLMDIV